MRPSSLPELAFPNARTFADLFVADQTVPWDNTKGTYPPNCPPPDQFPAEDTEYRGRGLLPHKVSYSIPIGPYCCVSGQRDGFRSMGVKARPEVAEYIRTHMIAPRYDAIYFKLTIRDDNTVLVTASNNQILASRWLAEITIDSIPTFPA